MADIGKHLRMDTPREARKTGLILVTLSVWGICSAYAALHAGTGSWGAMSIAALCAAQLVLGTFAFLHFSGKIVWSGVWLLVTGFVALFLGAVASGSMVSVPAVLMAALPLCAGLLLQRVWVISAGATSLAGVYALSKFVPPLDMAVALGILTLAVTAGTLLFQAIASRITEKLAKTSQQVLHTTQAKARILSSMSHAMRTRMNGVTAPLSLIVDREDLPGDVRGQIRLALESSTALMSEFGDIADVSRLQAGGKGTLGRAPFDPAREIDEVVFLHQASNGGRRINIKRDLSIPKGLRLVGDASRLRQVLVKLIANALKHAKGSAVTLRARATQRDAGEWSLSIDVFRTEAMPGGEAEPVRIFHQAEAAGSSHPYSDLDLTVCHQLVDLMQGDFTIAGGRDQPSMFRVRFTMPEAAGDSQMRGIRKDWSASLSGLNVLVVEDNRVNQIVIANILEVLDCDVAIASNGREAIGAVQGRDFDLILLDIALPEMDGLQTLRAIRKLGSQYADIPVIAVTARASQADQDKVKENGIAGYVSKPFEAATLVSEIRTVLGAEASAGHAAQPGRQS